MVFPVVGGDGKPTGYDIDNSLRFDLASNSDLAQTFSSAGNRRTWTWSGWIKRAKLGTRQQIFHQYNALDNNQWVEMRFEDSDALTFSWYSQGVFVTKFLFRDPSAWYHIVLALDTTDGTSGNRVKLYINGNQIADNSDNFAGGMTIPSQNYDTGMNQDSAHALGHAENNGNFNAGFYLAEVHSIDGSQKQATDFGEFNDNGVWIPKEYDGTYGTNGYYLQFQQTGTSANSSGIGADTSGNDHHFTPTNFTATDITTDTCTNNFCTLNPLSAGSDIRANGSFKEGNCELVNGDTTGESNGQKCQGTMGFANGKWYWEVKLISNTMTAGIVDSSISTASDINLGSKNAVTYDSETGIINNINGNVQGETVSSQYDDGDIIGVAVDADNGAVYFAKNNTYQNSGNPTSGASKTGGATFTLGNQMLPLAADNSSATAGNHQYNFGNAPFSISSGNADANGYGNFEYAPPSGYYSICTKNLAEFG